MPAPFFAGCAGMFLALAACGPAPNAPAARQPSRALADSGPEAPQRHKIGNLQGLGHRSRIVFASYPDRPHELELSFAFPERARSLLRPEGARLAQRALNYRFGDQLWSIAPGKKESQQLTGVHAAEAVMEFELRRALFLWPLGFDWTAAGKNRLRAEVDGFGHLEAVLDGDPPHLPIQMEAFDAEDQERESFRAVSWIEEDERARPAGFDMYLRGGFVWEEEVIEVDTETRYLDAWFLPADKRMQPGGDAVRTNISFQLAPLVFKRRDLAPNTTLPEAIAEAERQMALSEQALSPSPHVELTPAGVPAAIWLVLHETAARPDSPSWQDLEGGPAIGRFLPNPTLVPQDLREVRAASDGAPRALFLRVQPAHMTPRRAELVWVASLPPREH
jgi:hypothetical protein